VGDREEWRLPLIPMSASRMQTSLAAWRELEVRHAAAFEAE
jgi:hypothetical protein